MTNNNSSTNSQHSGGNNLTVYICIHLVMPCAVAIGIIGNLLSILVFARREMIKFCVSMLTIVLAVSDILLLTTSLFNIILPDFRGGSLSDESVFWCHFHGYFDLLFAGVSGYSVVFISVERWFSIWKPFEKSKYVTFKSTLIIVISYILISIFGFSWFPFTLNYNPDQPKPAEKCELSRPTVYKIFGTISVIFTYIVPFFFLGILNILIVYRLHARQNTVIQRSLMQSSSTFNTDSSFGSSSTRKRQHKQRNTDRNITLMLITVAIAFMVMTFPYQIYWFYMQIRQVTAQNTTLVTLTQTFRYLNCCCNFFLYSATSSLFRRELREIFQWKHSLKANQKSINVNDDQRPRRVSTLQLGSLKKNNVPSERRILFLQKQAQASSTKTTVENFNLPDSINGNMASCKT
ncbi:unnamed protein product [Rotaria sp. Silwood2]|nr:unnamed protein product [Rotaria sp. Silwood2]CAF2561045.1 unnamed protein product [Rotaria sp. Silwood2]CAF2822080.1 unnamed protein product [Rotaria sp. Silwood2]CAF2983186.1 unnamed protein product [Rotaria sp. Silwood2]CAF3931093.1 unnamed protein product [Rotaria sp. Silwood2]